tara:strand:+ start:981 stop:1772 length:792 start_codon:yes stop_codon:yes gene_type:complete
MHGLGNDFIIFDNVNDLIIHDTKFIKKICNRRFGIGCDQVLIIQDTLKSDNYKVTMYNSDGSETGACGNGTRCVADYLMKRDNLNSLNIQSITGDLLCVKDDDFVTVNMGKPRFGWKDIPLSSQQNTQKVILDEFEAFCLSMGNPHAVIFIKTLDELETLNLNLIGPRLEKNISFPEFANIEFACVLEDETIRMRVWERGVGITMACGSGACATLVAAHKLNKSSVENKIILDGGTLFIKWLDNGTVTLSGNTEKVYDGIIGN